MHTDIAPIQASFTWVGWMAFIPSPKDMWNPA